ELRLRCATLSELTPVRLQHLLGTLQLAYQVIRPLARQRRAQVGLLPSLDVLGEAGRRFLDPWLERGKLLLGGQLGIGERTLPVPRFDLQLLGLGKQPPNSDQLLAQ